MYKVIENSEVKIVTSENYNSMFNKETGEFVRFGKTVEDDPDYCDWLPEILDLEISQGKCSMNCPHCYKSNGEDNNTKHMTFEQFQNVFHKVANTKFIEKDGKMFFKNESPLTQIAYGITDVNSNPDFFRMMEYSRNYGVIPNYTTNGMFVTDEVAKETARLCGAVAVSVYENKNIAYNAIKKFTDAGMTQVNIHFMLAEQTFDRLFEIFNDIKTDKRLEKLNAIVLLGYKPKGSGTDSYNILPINKFNEVVDFALENNISLGFDSCSANRFIKAVKNRPNAEELIQLSELCESACFSSYINCEGIFYSCSFSENEGMWKDGINVLECSDFSKEVWNNQKTQQFREMLLKNGRKCPMFNLDNEE